MADDWGDDDDWGADGNDDAWGDAGDDVDGWADGGDDAMGDGDDELSLDVRMENTYYEAEDLRLEHSTQDALTCFKKLLELAEGNESELSDESTGFMFKSLVQICSLHYELHEYDQMMVHFKRLLAFITKVTRNEAQDAVNTVLTEVNECKDMDFVKSVYQTASEIIRSLPDQERLWFRINMKYCEMFYSRGESKDVEENLNELLRSCQLPDGTDDPSKGAELLEIYAMLTRVSINQQNSYKLKWLYEKTKNLTAAVKDPKSQSVIRECWGQMFGDQGDWSRAYSEFYSAFNSYSEIGQQHKAKQCLKYVVVSNMMSGGEHNPFDAREAKVYQNDKEIDAIDQMRKAHENVDVAKFNKALKEIKKDGDKFILRHLSGLIRDFQGKSIEQTIKSYRRIRLQYLAEELKIDTTEVEALLIQLILDGRVIGKIDQVQGLLDLSQKGVGGGAKYTALSRWTSAVERLRSNLPTPTVK